MIRQLEVGSQHGKLDRVRGATTAVGVVEKRAGLAVVDNAVIGALRLVAPDEGAGRKDADTADFGKYRVIQLDEVLARTVVL